MYLSLKAISNAYEKLDLITPGTSGETGKKAGERTSAIRYLLATIAGLTRTGLNDLALHPDDPSNQDNRVNFIKDVGSVVRLLYLQESAGPYSANFKSMLGEHDGFGVGNNFLTTSLKHDGFYPNRPKGFELISKLNQSLSLHPDWVVHFSSFGDFSSYSSGLAVWLVRFDDLGDQISDEQECLNRIRDVLLRRYGAELTDLLLADESAVKELLVDENTNLLLQTEPEQDLTSFVRRKSKDGNGSQDKAGHFPFGHSAAENVIYYGAPGTGKSFRIKTRTMTLGEDQVIRTVFHSEYQNCDFMGSLQPSSDDNGNPTYEFIPGPFTKAFISAISNRDQDYVLIIEELNRANAAAVFGDVFQLLDRDCNGQSEYLVQPDEQLKKYIYTYLDALGVSWDGYLVLPPNLSILATMNSADQGVLPMDSAFKRRWRFEYMPIDFSTCPSGFVPHAGKMYEWGVFAQAVNEILLSLSVEEDKLLGPWFLSEKDLSAGAEAISGKLFVYLWDDVLRHLPRGSVFSGDIKSFGNLSNQYLNGKSVLSDELIRVIDSSFDSISEMEVIGQDLENSPVVDDTSPDELERVDT